MEYGQAHDYPALLGYCASPEVARKILREVPPHVYAGPGLKISRISREKEKIEIGDDDVFVFEVERRGDRWLVVAFWVQ
jgi:hypothetical protein